MTVSVTLESLTRDGEEAMGLISGIPSNRLHFQETFGVFLKGFDHFCIIDGA